MQQFKQRLAKQSQLRKWKMQHTTQPEAAEGNGGAAPMPSPKRRGGNLKPLPDDQRDRCFPAPLRANASRGSSAS